MEERLNGHPGNGSGSSGGIYPYQPVPPQNRRHQPYYATGDAGDDDDDDDLLLVHGQQQQVGERWESRGPTTPPHDQPTD